MSCTCSPGYSRIDSLTITPELALQDPENATCRAAYDNAKATLKYNFDNAIAANLDPKCSECALTTALTKAVIEFNLGEANNQSAYWSCRQANG